MVYDEIRMARSPKALDERAAKIAEGSVAAGAVRAILSRQRKKVAELMAERGVIR